MAILPLVHYPDPRIRNKTIPVTQIDENIRKIVDDMFETMYHENGVGLAATQVAITHRIAVIDVSEDRKHPMVAINPEIISATGEQTEPEGCLSVPGAYDKVKRAAKVHFKALNIDGKEYEVHAEGLLAACIQHEIDHLDGKLFIDHLSSMKRDRAKKRAEKFRNRQS